MNNFFIILFIETIPYREHYISLIYTISFSLNVNIRYFVSSVRLLFVQQLNIIMNENAFSMFLLSRAMLDSHQLSVQTHRHTRSSIIYYRCNINFFAFSGCHFLRATREPITSFLLRTRSLSSLKNDCTNLFEKILYYAPIISRE